MSGPEHYKEAETLLAECTGDDGSVSFGDGGEAVIAAAQVHATLALAAATALSNLDGNIASDHAWLEAAGGAS